MNYTDYQSALDRILQAELERFCAEIEVTQGKVEPPSPRDARALIEYADFARRSSSRGQDRRLSMLGLGLLWEHSGGPESEYIEEIRLALMRAGFATASTMIDPRYSADDPYFSRFQGARQQIEATVQVARQLVPLASGDHIFTDFQIELWNTLRENARVGVSAPTSSGKSYVLCQKVCEILESAGGLVLYVVPTLALVNQVTSDLRKMTKEWGHQHVVIEQTIPTIEENEEAYRSYVFVVTQERALSGLANLKGRSVDCAIFDEIQNIERFATEPDERSSDLRELVAAVEADLTPALGVAAGPRIEDIDTVARELFGGSAVGLTDEVPPVSNITFGLSREKKKNVVRLYAEGKVPAFARTVGEDGPVRFDKLSGVQYRDPVKDAIKHIVCTAGRSRQTIVFGPTKKAAGDIAAHLASSERQYTDVGDELEALADYIAETVHPRFRLVECVKNGVGYHHGTVPSHVRQCVEYAFRESRIGVVVSTTTLIQGVNLPASLVVVRNPALSGSRSGARLTGYEFANLKGRAGRLMKDFVGRCVVLDEPMFAQSEIDLTVDSTRSLNASYSDRYGAHRSEIETVLSNRESAFSAESDPDIVTYIRHAVASYGSGASDRMRQVGINAPDKVLSEVGRHLASLESPIEYLKAHRHWDPIDLEKIFKAYKEGSFAGIPLSPFDLGFVDRWRGGLGKLAEICSEKFDRYIGDNRDGFITKLLISADRWACEEPLRNIVGWNDDVDEIEVDRMLNLLNSSVPYNLPKLISPVVWLKNKDSGLLSMLETGTNREITRDLLELGVGRELGIRVADLLAARGVTASELQARTSLRDVLATVRGDMHQWEVAQLRALELQ